MILIWTKAAKADRRSIREYIARENSLQQSNWTNVSAGVVPETRELVVRSNYLLVYSIEGDAIRVLPVLHAAQQWPPEQD